MGDIADGILEGIFCEKCGQYMDGPPAGYPVTCGGCLGEEGEATNG